MKSLRFWPSALFGLSILSFFDCNEQGRSVGSVAQEGAVDGDQGKSGSGGDPGGVGACKGQTGTGEGVVRDCNSGNSKASSGVTCDDMLDKCAAVAAGTTMSIECTWNRIEIFERELTPGACGAANPCAGQIGEGATSVFDCGSGETVAATEFFTCPGAIINCVGYADSYPEKSVECTWNGIKIFEREAAPGACDAPSACEGQTGTGEGITRNCDSGNSKTSPDITCDAMLFKCLQVAGGTAFNLDCTWNGVEIFRREVQPGTCGAGGVREGQTGASAQPSPSSMTKPDPARESSPR
jgi:hypothetical protein